MSTRVRAVIRLREPADGGGATIADTYRTISWVSGGIDGLRRTELMRDVDERDSYLLMSEWETLEQFRTWQQGPDHQDNPSALRSFQDRGQGRHWALYEIASVD